MVRLRATFRRRGIEARESVFVGCIIGLLVWV
jgi:hypothetical protein